MAHHQGREEFYDVTKTIHNALQGNPQGLTAEQLEIFRRYQALNAEAFEDDYDFVVVHDPQPVGMVDFYPRPARTGSGEVTSTSPRRITRSSMRCFRRSAVTTRRFSTCASTPSADGASVLHLAACDRPPRAEEHGSLRGDAAYIVDQFGIDVERPLLTQVSRFDPWKDPLGVIDAYRLVKEQFPGMQLALVGSMAHDDPEGWDFYNQTVAYAAGDPDIYILSNLNNVGSVEVNAFQVHSAAVLQKSIREGFGLTVTEALWKTRPTVAGRVGGIVAQIQDGETGWLVDSATDCARACIEILSDPAAARQRALKGKEYVRRNFLTPRLLRDWLVLFNRLLGNETAGAELAVVAAA